MNIILFIIGLGVGAFFSLGFSPISIGLGNVVDLIVVSIAVFLLSMIFYGYLSPLVFLYLGFVSNKMIFSNPIGVLGFIVPLVIASYAGGVAANYASMDMNGEGNFFQHWKGIAAMLIAAVIVAAIWAVVMGLLPSFQDLNALFLP